MDARIAFILCLAMAVHAAHNYAGHRVIRIFVNNPEHWTMLEDMLERMFPEIDIWSEPSAGDPWADVQLSAEEFRTIQPILTSFGFSYQVTINDVQSLLEKSQSEPGRPPGGFRHKRDATLSNDVIGTYATFEEIEAYLHDVEAFFPDIAQVTEIGRSYEDRPLLVIKLGVPRATPKPALWLDGTMHAREWISPASVMYIIYRLLRDYTDGDPHTVDMLSSLDWFILPVCNPDGYVYTHAEDGDRLWRKNRSPNPPTDYGVQCNGTDLNRNWDFHWGEVRASTNPCSITFRGSAPASELETQAIAAAILALRGQLFVYVTVHSYAQTWFTRWSYTENLTDTHNETMALAERAVEALVAEGGVTFRAGRSPTLLYSYSGGSPDWAHGVAGIRYSFALEMRDKGEWGFLLPASNIDVSGRELYAGLQVVADHLCNLTCHLTNLTTDFNFNSSPENSRYVSIVTVAMLLITLMLLM